MKTDIIQLTTDLNDDGTGIKIVGYFKGTIEQIINYCLKKSIKPTNHFRCNNISIIDVSDTKTEITVTKDYYGRLSYSIPKEIDEKILKNNDLSKLTSLERKLLRLEYNQL